MRAGYEQPGRVVAVRAEATAAVADEAVEIVAAAAAAGQRRRRSEVLPSQHPTK